MRYNLIFSLITLIGIILFFGCINSQTQDESRQIRQRGEPGPKPFVERLVKVGTKDDVGYPSPLLVYNNSLYVAASDDIKKLQGDEWVPVATGDKVGQVNSFVIYGEELYAGSSRGIFKLKGDGWLQTSNKFTYVFKIYNDQLYAGGDGITKLKGDRWVELESVDKVGFIHAPFIVYGDELYSQNVYKGAFKLEGDKFVKSDALSVVGEAAFLPMKSIKYKNEWYVGGDRGIFKSKGEKLVKSASYEEVGDVAAFTVYKDELYAATRKGIFKLQGDKWIQLAGKDKTEIVEFFFIEYGNNLYAASRSGVFRLKEDGWVEVAGKSQLENPSYMYSLPIYNDELYITTDTGIYKLTTK